MSADTASGQTRALVPLGLTQRARTLTRDSIEGILAGMLPPFQIVEKKDGNGKVIKGKDDKPQTEKKQRSNADRIALIESLVLRHPDNPHAPFFVSVNWSGEFVHTGDKAVPIAKKGGGYEEREDGSPKMVMAQHLDLWVSGHTMVPDPKKPQERIQATVLPLVVCDGRKGILPYGKIKIQNGKPVFSGVNGMLCYLVHDIDPWTWRRRYDRDGNPIYKAVPCGASRHGSVNFWNEIVTRRWMQDNSYPKDREIVEPMAHNLYGRSVLKLTPGGHPAVHGGFIALFRKERQGRGRRRDRKRNPSRPDWLVIGTVAGKKVTAMTKRVQLILPAEGEAFKPHKLAIDEGWSSIRATVDGLWGAGKVEIHEVGADQETIDALEALGITLYDAGPRDVRGVVRRVLRLKLDDKNPLWTHLVQQRHLEEDTDPKVAKRHIRGLGGMLETEATKAIRQAYKDLVHNLGAAGRENAGMPNISDILPELTPEALLTAHRQDNGTCPLAQFIVESSTAKRYGLEVWDWSCWVLRQARKDLLKNLAHSQADGLKLPPRKKKVEAKDAETDGGEEGSDEPSIVWHENMLAKHLYPLAKGLEGVTSKTDKQGLIDALSKVCPQTASANPKAKPLPKPAEGNGAQQASA